MLLCRTALDPVTPEWAWAAGESTGSLRRLLDDPLRVPPSAWRLGEALAAPHLLAPIVPGKIVGIGRNYREHAAELGNAMPAEPLLFLKAISSRIGPGDAILLPPESEDVQYEGEVAVVVGRRVTRAGAEAAAAAVLGYTAACDVTARDLQQRDRTFARGKSFDTFCPLGPAIRMGVPGPEVSVVTRVDGAERQRATVADMTWGPVELVVYVSRFMTLEPGDVLLTGTPAGVGTLRGGERVEVEVSGVGALVNPVAAWRG